MFTGMVDDCLNVVNVCGQQVNNKLPVMYGAITSSVLYAEGIIEMVKGFLLSRHI